MSGFVSRLDEGSSKCFGFVSRLDEGSSKCFGLYLD